MEREGELCFCSLLDEICTRLGNVERMLHDKRLGACCSVLAIAIAQSGAPVLTVNGLSLSTWQFAQKRQRQQEREKEKLKTVSNWKITNEPTKKLRVIVSHSDGKGT